jgi:hypothetical protein
MFLPGLPSSVREYLIELRLTCLRGGGLKKNDSIGIIATYFSRPNVA